MLKEYRFFLKRGLLRIYAWKPNRNVFVGTLKSNWYKIFDSLYIQYNPLQIYRCRWTFLACLLHSIQLRSHCTYSILYIPLTYMKYMAHSDCSLDVCLPLIFGVRWPRFLGRRSIGCLLARSHRFFLYLQAKDFSFGVFAEHRLFSYGRCGWLCESCLKRRQVFLRIHFWAGFRRSLQIFRVKYTNQSGFSWEIVIFWYEEMWILFLILLQNVFIYYCLWLRYNIAILVPTGN